MAYECPKCGCLRCRVSHTIKKSVTVYGKTYQINQRWRVCGYCGYTYKTREVPEKNDIQPSDKTREEPETPIDMGNPFL